MSKFHYIIIIQYNDKINSKIRELLRKCFFQMFHEFWKYLIKLHVKKNFIH